MEDRILHSKRVPHPDRKTVAFICNKHGFVRGGTCPQCEEERPNKAPNINSQRWVEGWYEHIDREPIYIKDKKHLVRECEKRGLVARAFMKPKSRGDGYEHAK